MPSYICPTCKEVNEEHRKYCKSCGTWLLSTKFPSIPTKETTAYKPKWFLIEQLFLIGLFVFLAVIVFLGAENARNSAFGIMKPNIV